MENFTRKLIMIKTVILALIVSFSLCSCGKYDRTLIYHEYKPYELPSYNSHIKASISFNTGSKGCGWVSDDYDFLDIAMRCKIDELDDETIYIDGDSNSLEALLNREDKFIGCLIVNKKKNEIMLSAYLVDKSNGSCTKSKYNGTYKCDFISK